jgi:hypothetical protein
MDKDQIQVILNVCLPALTAFLVIRYTSDETKENEFLITSDSINDKLYITVILPYNTFLLKRELFRYNYS